MSIISRHPRTLAVGAACALTAGGIGAITNAGAATAQHRGSHAHHASRADHAGGGRLARLERRAVHAQLTVPTKSGFATVTIDRGVVDSVSGDTLTMTESTPHLTGGQVNLTIPASAVVHNDRKPASLSALTAGERVTVVMGVKRTTVRAHAAKVK